jgi:DNA-binding transcriptional ArsR family regulator
MSNYESVQPEEAPEPAPRKLGEDQRAILEIQASFCRTMGHPIRLYILHHLNETGGEVGSSELADLAGISRATLSQHLSKMTSVGLVKTRREGKYVYVRLARKEIGQACEFVHSALQSELRQRAELVQDPEGTEQTE